MSWRYTPHKFFFEGFPLFAALKWMAVNFVILISGFIIAYFTRYLWPDVIYFNEVWWGFLMGFTGVCLFNIAVHLLAVDYVEEKRRQRGEAP